MLDIVDFGIHCCHPVVRVRRAKPLTSHLRVGVNVGCGPSNSPKGARRCSCCCVGWLGVPRRHTHRFSDVPRIKCKAVGSKRWRNMICIQPHLTTASCLSLTVMPRAAASPHSDGRCHGTVTELSSATSVGSVISEPWTGLGRGRGVSSGDGCGRACEKVEIGRRGS